MSALQQPPQLSDMPPRSGGGLQDAHSRLVELQLAATSILEEITRVGGVVAGERGGNWRQTASPATGTVPQVEIGASSATSSGSGGGQAHHVGVGVQPLPATSSPGGGRCREQPAASASLRVASNIHTHEVLKRKQPLIASASTSASSGPQDVQPAEEAFAAARSGDWRSGGRPPQHPARKQEQPRPATALITFYNCGLRGHVASGCRAPRQRASGPRPDDAQVPKSSQHSPQDVRGTPPPGIRAVLGAHCESFRHLYGSR
ncbi:uncharacterized protein LOC144953020 [Lampetra fluviatilis]